MTGLAVLGVIGGWVAITIWSGYVLSILWRWFFVPIFALPALSVAQAIGVSIVAAYLTKTVHSSKEEGWEPVIKALGVGLLYPLLALILGWFVKAFL